MGAWHFTEMEDALGDGAVRQEGSKLLIFPVKTSAAKEETPFRYCIPDISPREENT